MPNGKHLPLGVFSVCRSALMADFIIPMLPVLVATFLIHRFVVSPFLSIGYTTNKISK